MADKPERSPGPAIREYTPGDQTGFEHLVRTVHLEFGFAYDPVLDADLVDPPAFYIKTWVLIGTDDTVAGSVALRESEDGVELKRMYLKPELRSQGYGRSLLETALTWAREAGYKYVDLDTAEHLTGAQRFYERAGFELNRRADGDAGPCTLYYRLALEQNSS